MKHIISNLEKTIDNKTKIINQLNETIENITRRYESEVEVNNFNQLKNEEYIKEQNLFCDTLNSNLNIGYDEKIIKS